MIKQRPAGNVARLPLPSGSSRLTQPVPVKVWNVAWFSLTSSRGSCSCCSVFRLVFNGYNNRGAGGTDYKGQFCLSCQLHVRENKAHS